MKTLILGSQSPRRKEILTFFKLPFIQVSPDFDAEAAEVNPDPHIYAASLAAGKVSSLIEKYPGSVILGADTVVFKDGNYYAKPQNRDEARQFIKDFSGAWQTVVTGMAISVEGKLYTESSETLVKFNRLSDAAIEAYLDHNIWQDKAGGYTIVGTPSLLVERIDGCFYNVMGLPVNTLASLLLKADIDLWQHF